mmetsp:Transcript_13403/g.27354  ORF Transcript_13403/g.27354 Transcript_13403/m.27354 type:complete len:109 (-) Transcript_13403:243-569(-)
MKESKRSHSDHLMGTEGTLSAWSEVAAQKAGTQSSCLRELPRPILHPPAQDTPTKTSPPASSSTDSFASHNNYPQSWGRMLLLLELFVKVVGIVEAAVGSFVAAVGIA